MIFDGKRLAKERTEFLSQKIKALGVSPSIVIFQVGDDPASKIFIDLKTKKAMELGVTVEHIKLPAGEGKLLEELLIERVADENVDGVMVQLPAIGIDKNRIEEILGLIDKGKDVDGLNPLSGVVPAVVRAVENAYKYYVENFGEPKVVAVVGFRGNLGRQFMNIYQKRATVIGLDLGDDLSRLKEADLVILCTGQAKLVQESMLKRKAGVIDLGASVGEFLPSSTEFEGFVTPVPGGIGPMTVISLFENLLDLVFERDNARI